MNERADNQFFSCIFSPEPEATKSPKQIMSPTFLKPPKSLTKNHPNCQMNKPNPTKTAVGSTALFATFHENERPLLGLAGLMDWRLSGLISFSLKGGAISGKIGEWAYFPVLKSHVLLLGMGASEKPGARSSVSESSIRELKLKCEKLKITKLILSGQDLGYLQNPSQLKQLLGGIEVCFAP